MRYRLRAIAAIVLTVTLSGATGSRADSLLLRSGTLVEGHVPNPTYTLQTSSGELEIPRSSIRTITFSASTVEITLRDNTTVTGALALETVELQQPMMLRRVPVGDLREILFSEDAATPAPATQAAAGSVELTAIPAGSEIALELARTLSSAGTSHAGETVPLCVAADVILGGRVAIPAGRIALGELAVVDPAGAGNREGRLVLEVKRTWTQNGVEVPLQGQVAFEGRFNASNVAALGAVGLLAQGGQATALAGTAVSATLTHALTLEDAVAGSASPGNPAPWPKELQERCDLYRRFRNGPDADGWLRVSEVPKDLDLAAMKSPMRLEFAIPRLAAMKKGEMWQGFLVRRFLCDDVSFATLSLTRAGGSKSKATFDFDAMVKVEPSYDRWVDLRLELVAGEKTLAQAAIGHVDAEEGKAVSVQARLVADAAAVAAAAGEPTALRVTVYVTRND